MRSPACTLARSPARRGAMRSLPVCDPDRDSTTFMSACGGAARVASHCGGGSASRSTGSLTRRSVDLTLHKRAARPRPRTCTARAHVDDELLLRNAPEAQIILRPNHR